MQILMKMLDAPPEDNTVEQVKIDGDTALLINSSGKVVKSLPIPPDVDRDAFIASLFSQ